MSRKKARTSHKKQVSLSGLTLLYNTLYVFFQAGSFVKLLSFAIFIIAKKISILLLFTFIHLTRFLYYLTRQLIAIVLYLTKHIFTALRTLTTTLYKRLKTVPSHVTSSAKIPRKYSIAAAWGVVIAFLVFMLVSGAIKLFPQKDATIVGPVRIFDRAGTLLYSTYISPSPKKDATVAAGETFYKRAPYAVDYTLSVLKNTHSEKELRRGMDVVTTIDLPLQNYMQQLVLEEALNKNENTSDVSVLVTGKDASILVLIESVNYFDSPKSTFSVPKNYAIVARVTDYAGRTHVQKNLAEIRDNLKVVVWVKNGKGEKKQNAELASKLHEKVRGYQEDKELHAEKNVSLNVLHEGR